MVWAEKVAVRGQDYSQALEQVYPPKRGIESEKVIALLSHRQSLTSATSGIGTDHPIVMHERRQKQENTMINRYLLLTSLLASFAYSGESAVSIPTQKGDNGRSGLTPSETTLTLQNVNSSTFGQLFQRPAVGDMYPQPLIAGGLNIGGGNHNVVFLATAANNVYAYDADDAAIIAPYWSRNLGTPVPATDVDCCCSDIATVVGVIGTPVARASRTVPVLPAIGRPSSRVVTVPSG